MERFKVQIDRKEMYDLVWSKPLTEISEEFGTSAVAIGKRCRSHGIPLPGVGYWQKKEAGKEVYQIALPRFEGPQKLTFFVKIPGEETVEPQVIVEVRQFETSPENKVQVGKQLNNPHKLVSTAKNILERRETHTEKGHQIYASEPCLNIHVTKSCLGRALRIMDALIKALESRGAFVKLEGEEKCVTVVIMGEEKVKIDLYEGFRMVKPKKSPGTWELREYEATGELILRIESATYMRCRHLWRDGTKLKLEERLNDFIIGLRIVAELERASRIRREEYNRQWREEEHKRKELERKRQEELDRLVELKSEVANWRMACQIRAYVEEVRRSTKDIHGAIAPGGEGEKWIEWALEQAERIDPLR